MFKWIVGSVTWCYCSWIVNDLIVHYVSLCYIVLMFMNIHDLFFLVRFPADGPRFCPNTCARCSRFCLCCFCGGVRYDLDQDWLVVSECFRYIRYKDILYTYIYIFVTRLPLLPLYPSSYQRWSWELKEPAKVQESAWSPSFAYGVPLYHFRMPFSSKLKAYAPRREKIQVQRLWGFQKPPAGI